MPDLSPPDVDLAPVERDPFVASAPATPQDDDEVQQLQANYARNKGWTKPDASNFNTDLGNQEPQFRQWVQANKVPFDPSATGPQDYDMRGFWKGLQTGDPNAKSAVDPNDSKLHYPDYWKTPYHQTFSNESQWAAPNAPRWNDQDQLIGQDGKIMFDDRRQLPPPKMVSDDPQQPDLQPIDYDPFSLQGDSSAVMASAPAATPTPPTEPAAPAPDADQTTKPEPLPKTASPSDNPARIDQRIPTAKTPVEAAGDGPRTVDLDAMKLTPDLYDHNVGLVRDYPGVNIPKNYGTDKAADTIYAGQKVGRLPDWVMEEGRHDPVDLQPVEHTPFSHYSRFANNTVVGDVVGEPGKGASIYEWSSHNPGEGNTIKALADIKNKYKGPISVHDIGEPGTDSFNYWKKMQARGLVDKLLDADDNVIENESKYASGGAIDPYADFRRSQNIIDDTNESAAEKLYNNFVANVTGKNDNWISDTSNWLQGNAPQAAPVVPPTTNDPLASSLGYNDIPGRARGGRALPEKYGTNHIDYAFDINRWGMYDKHGYLIKSGLIKDDVPKRAHGGRVEPLNIHPNPSEAQKRSGNYAKDHIHFQGMAITIENAKGAIRRGVGPDGEPWEVHMPCAYGYIKRTKGADDDQVDCYIGPHPKASHVFIIDQVDHKTKRFDEHKTLLGFGTERQALLTYQRGFSDGKGKDRVGKITAIPVAQFRHWLQKGDTKNPFGTTRKVA